MNEIPNAIRTTGNEDPYDRVVHESAVGVEDESWDAWRADVTQPLPPAPLIAPGTASCSHCWGQGRLWAPARNGEGLIPQSCEACDGSGLVLTEPSA